jgi:hypothetical protein
MLHCQSLLALVVAYSSAGTVSYAGYNVQLYPCSNDSRVVSHQSFMLSNGMVSFGTQQGLVLSAQIPSPTNSTTCSEQHCVNVVLMAADSANAIKFELIEGKLVSNVKPLAVPLQERANCATEQGIDYLGGDIGKLAACATDVQACCTLCGNTSGCNYFSFGKALKCQSKIGTGTGSCYLKSSIGSKTKNAGRVSGRTPPTPAPAPSPSPPAGSLCLAADWSHSHGYLPNVQLTDCASADSWAVHGKHIQSTHKSAHKANKSMPASMGASMGASARAGSNLGLQCLDVGSGGSTVGNFSLPLLPAPAPATQAFNSSAYASWGGSVIQDNETGAYHMFAAVFIDGTGLNSWQSNSEIMHAVAATPEGPFEMKEVVVKPFAHNPQVVRVHNSLRTVIVVVKPFAHNPHLVRLHNSLCTVIAAVRRLHSSDSESASHR